MREIRFPGRQYNNTQRVLNGIKWATWRKGTRKWESDNVPITIHKYLVEHGADSVIYNPPRIKWVMRLLRDHGYAELTLRKGGKRFIRMQFLPDVDLTGWTPEFVEERMQEEPKLTFDSTIVFDEDDDSALPIPIPKPEKPQRYKATELNELLDRFAEKEPEVYGIYAEKLERGLTALLERESN